MTDARIPLLRSPLQEKGISHVTDEQPRLETQDETLFDNPQFVHYEQTSNIQLFFDLFFVANLTTFTNQHEINSIDKLSSYIGFFCILWFTWCQVTLYDVRFATDSVFERICHACHFGVMVGLAVVGPQFDPSDTFFSSLQQLSLLLMASRFVLMFQYGSTMYFIWRYRKTRLPLALVIGTLFISAVLYLALSFVFSAGTNPKAYIAWYIIAVFEVGSNIAIAGIWHILSFKNTHLVERMTCLTLIVLGEGVIGLTKSIATIESLDFFFNAATIGTIISAVAIIYLLYQLYFDSVNMENFGTIRQQIWAFLHFPFHMALVLLMEGTNQFVIYGHITQIINLLFSGLDSLSDNASEADLFNTLETIANITFTTFPPLTNETGIQNALAQNLQLLAPGTNATETQAESAANEILTTLITAVFDGYGFEPPEVPEGASFDTILNSYYSLFELVFGYFFVCAGLVLIFIGIFSWLVLSKSREDRSIRKYIGTFSLFLVGLGLTMLSTMVLTDAADNLGSSSWTLPLLVFVLLIVLLLNHIPPRSYKLSKGSDRVE